MEIESDSRIRQLSKEEIEKLSAGQVVISPLHIVKELVENSIDAGSKKISIIIKSPSGLKSVSELQITDDGCGIKKENFEFLCKTHYTTKKKGTMSFGFRGEALSFVSRSCKVNIQSNTGHMGFEADYEDCEILGGVQVLPDGRRKLNIRPVSMPKGTKITLTEIFHKFKQRRSQLDIDKDCEKIKQLMWKFSLCHTSIQFTVSKNGSKVFTNKLSKPVENKVEYGHEMLNMACRRALKLEDFEYQKIEHSLNEDFHAYLLFTKVNIEYSKKTTAFFFNGRYFESATLESCVRNAYY